MVRLLTCHPEARRLLPYWRESGMFNLNEFMWRPSRHCINYTIGTAGDMTRWSHCNSHTVVTRQNYSNVHTLGRKVTLDSMICCDIIWPPISRQSKPISAVWVAFSWKLAHGCSVYQYYNFMFLQRQKLFLLVISPGSS